MSPEDRGPYEGVRVRHDLHSLPAPELGLFWGCPTPAAQLPRLWLQGRGGTHLLVPPQWAASPAPTVPPHLHLMLDRDILGLPPRPDPVREDGGDPRETPAAPFGQCQAPLWGDSLLPREGV